MKISVHMCEEGFSALAEQVITTAKQNEGMDLVTTAAADWTGAAVEAEAMAMEAGVATSPGRCSEAGEAGDEVGEAATTTELTRIEEEMKIYPACK